MCFRSVGAHNRCRLFVQYDCPCAFDEAAGGLAKNDARTSLLVIYCQEDRLLWPVRPHGRGSFREDAIAVGSAVDVADYLKAAIAILDRKPSALFTDLDGTISPIASRPQDAKVDSQTVSALRRLSRLLDVVGIVSGRSLSELHSIVNVESLTYIGNHGLEWSEDGHSVIDPAARPFLPRIAATVRWLEDRLDIPGLLLENKGVTGAIHYRMSPDPLAARGEILSALAACQAAHGLRISPGRKVIDILPPVASGKGTAMERMVRFHHLKGVVYLGDDSTDLNAFRNLRALGTSEDCDVLLLAVSSSEAPEELLAEADYHLDGVDNVIAFLKMVAARLEMNPADAGESSPAAGDGRHPR